MKKTTVLVLAAGAGRRLKPIVTSKPLLPFLGKSLLEWLVKDLQRVGFEKFCLVVNPKDKNLVASLFPGSNFSLALQTQASGMAGAVLAAAKQLSGSLVVVNGDDLLSPQIYAHFVEVINRSKAKLVLTGLKVDHYLAGGYFQLQNNQVKGIIEKPGPDNMPSSYLNLVLHYFQSASTFIDQLKTGQSNQDDVYELALNRLLAQTPAQLVQTNGYFYPLKQPFHLLDLTAAFLSHRQKGSFVHPSARIMSGAIIKDSYIGPKVIVGNNALVRNSIVEAGSLIGYNTEIARSYVGPNNFFHSSYVGDSVIEANSNLGSGSRLANLRFDGQAIHLQKPTGKIATQKTKLGAILGQGVKLGINTSIMPGITIGQQAVIGSGVVLNQAIKPATKVFVNQNLTIKS